MVNLTSALNIATNALDVNQFALSVVSNNIANANTPGYSRERVLLQSTETQDGRFPVGTGVQILGTEAERNQVINSRLNQEMAGQSESETTQLGLSNIESLFNDSAGTGMLPSLTTFFNDFQALSADPTSSNLRQQLITDAGSMTDSFHAASSDLKSIQTQANQSVQSDVAEINSLTSQISQVTKQIQGQEATTQQPANELRDQRDTLVQNLSQLVQVHELDSGGTYQLSIAGGPTLVLNNTAVPLTAVPSGASGIFAIQSGGADITSEISGGDLGANLQMRDNYVPKYLQGINQLAYEVTQNVNGLHEAAYTPSGTTGIDFFTPMANDTDAAQNIAVSNTVSSNPQNIAASAQSSGLDNQAAINMGNLLNAPVFSGGSVTDQYGGLVYSIGADTAAANQAAQQHQALVQQLQNQQQSVSGVNIDEETVSVLQFQRAYQASANVINIVNQLLQTALTLSTGL